KPKIPIRPSTSGPSQGHLKQHELPNLCPNDFATLSQAVRLVAPTERDLERDLTLHRPEVGIVAAIVFALLGPGIQALMCEKAAEVRLPSGAEVEGCRFRS